MKTRDGFEKLRSPYCLVTNPITVNAWLLRRKEKKGPHIAHSTNRIVCSSARLPSSCRGTEFPLWCRCLLRNEKEFRIVKIKNSIPSGIIENRLARAKIISCKQVSLGQNLVENTRLEFKANQSICLLIGSDTVTRHL